MIQGKSGVLALAVALTAAVSGCMPPFLGENSSEGGDGGQPDATRADGSFDASPQEAGADTSVEDVAEGGDDATPREAGPDAIDGGDACSGGPGSPGCCTNACTVGAAQCASSTNLQTCQQQPSGCTASMNRDCSATQGMAGEAYVCERNGLAACLDPAWAEWPMPNSSVDVTSGAPNAEGYTNNGDGTVTDNVTGLMWQRSISSGTFTQATALSYCQTLALAGHSDWRLPSTIELVSLVDVTQFQPSIDGVAFPSTPPQPFVAAERVNANETAGKRIL